MKLAANERKMIAVRALAGTEPVSTLAVRHGVSRPLVYWQMHKASTALDELFSPAQTDDVDKVVFSQPVTRRWLEQATLGLTMIAHASMRGVVEFMHDVLGVSISPGSVHNILQQAAQRAVGINDSDDLSPIRVGLHDELLQGSQPVLTGIDAASTDCYLLAAEDHRDGDTWAIHLLDLQAQGLKPDYTLADAGTGLRAGQKLAWPDTPCHGNVFHICQQFETLVNFWARIASRVRPEREALEVRLANPLDAVGTAFSPPGLPNCVPSMHGRISSLRTFGRLPGGWSATSWPWQAPISHPVTGCSTLSSMNFINASLKIHHASARCASPCRISATTCSPSSACSMTSWPPSRARRRYRTIWSARPVCCIASPTPRAPSGKAGTGCMPLWGASSSGSGPRSREPWRARHAAARWLKTST
ncbi:hypothetical protein HHL24_36635 [Paraburkholderia sp. RP-4-7]|uniref:Uncharacterized protein n=1 Tax=Paraburkholderia polaris TaxID=2728848 RepID=A0A848ITT4_9BURK|nr:hypothetical protein [Paraburkholderia polaris]NMM03395.1 hypothetical protein [Paraburkholderia polaris]